MVKISKSDTTPETEAIEAAARERMANKKSMHFEPGTFVVYKNQRYLLLCYRESDGKMIIDNENETLALETYSMLNRR